MYHYPVSIKKKENIQKTLLGNNVYIKSLVTNFSTLWRIKMHVTLIRQWLVLSRFHERNTSGSSLVSRRVNTMKQNACKATAKWVTRSLPRNYRMLGTFWNTRCPEVWVKTWRYTCCHVCCTDPLGNECKTKKMNRVAYVGDAFYRWK